MNSKEWVRLYPIDYRYQSPNVQFKKYQWIEVKLSPTGQGNDNRRESRKPKLDSLKILGEPLPAGDWKQRREIIDSLPVHTRIELEHLYALEKKSLGIVKPTEVLEISIESAKREWKNRQQAALDQFHLFDGMPKKLEKIPYKFSYVFRCEDTKEPHRAMIEDWELGVLFLKERERKNSEREAAESVKNKFLEELCAPTRDTHFFMGTTFPFNSWVVLGVYWPPIKKQLALF